MLIVGIDGGGTKTEAVLCNETGHVLKRVKGGPSSPTNQSPETAVLHIQEVMTVLMADYGGVNGHIDALFAGLSGGGVGNNPAIMHELLVKMLPNCSHLENYNDAVTAFRSAVPSGDGLIAIAGTGSSIFACEKGKLHQVGGWGYLLGDEGSGFDLGRRALLSALRDQDGRGEKTSLTAACQKKLGVSVPAAIPSLYAAGKKGIADFATVLLEEAEKGDAEALAQLKQAASDMAESIMTAGRYISSQEKKTAIAGSIWKNVLYKKAVQSRLGENYILCSTDLPPVYGCVVLAMKMADVLPDPCIENEFRNSLPKEIKL